MNRKSGIGSCGTPLLRLEWIRRNHQNAGTGEEKDRDEKASGGCRRYDRWH